MRGYTLPDVCQCGFHEDREAGRDPRLRLAGLSVCLLPWVMLATWLIVRRRFVHHLIELFSIVAVPAFHHFFHKGAEHGIHTVIHRFKFLKVRLLPDAIMIAILIALDLVWDLFGKE